MKIIMFQGGLGNQLFEYVYYLYLRKKFPKEKIYGFYYDRWLKAHNGLEIGKWFDVSLPPTNCFIHIISFILYYSVRVLNLIGLTLSFYNYKFERDDNSFFQEGYWQDKTILEDVGAPSFIAGLEVDSYNKTILNKIMSSESVSVHIRRGDYLSPRNQSIYGNICTNNYYKKCIDEISKVMDSPTFFIFSNDLDYARDLFENESNCIIVNGNQGERSFYDMFLMSHCKGMILANSTFSCWAAYLNNNAVIVLSPMVWANEGIVPNVNLETWKTIDS